MCIYINTIQVYIYMIIIINYYHYYFYYDDDYSYVAAASQKFVEIISVMFQTCKIVLQFA